MKIGRRGHGLEALKKGLGKHRNPPREGGRHVVTLGARREHQTKKTQLDTRKTFWK